MRRGKRKQPQKHSPATGKWSFVLLTLLAFACYAQTLRYEFVYDDDSQILNNKFVTEPGHLKEIFLKNVWAFVNPEHKSNYYRPIHTLGDRILYALFGADPVPFHLLNVLLHSANTALLFALARRCLPEAVALVGAALFALHPGHTESVAWIAGVTDLWCALFLLGASYVYLLSDRRTLAWTLLFLCALLSKETALLWPAAMVVSDLALRRQELRRLMGRWLILCAVLAAYVGMRWYALGSFAPIQGFYYQLSTTEFLSSALALYGTYWWKMLVPAGLNAYYLFRPYPAWGAPVILSGVLVAVLALAVFWSWNKRPLWAVGGAWITLFLLPVLNIPGVGENVFADRYMYLPSVAFCLGLAGAWYGAWQRGAIVRRASVTGLGVVAAFYLYQTVTRNEVWKENLVLYQETLRQSPEAANIRTMLASYYLQREDYRSAIRELERALQKKDAFYHHVTLAQALYAQGRREEARVHYRLALERQASEEDLLVVQARLFELEGRLEDAVRLLRAAARRYPSRWDFHHNAGSLLLRMQRVEDAVQEFEMALQLRPGDAQRYYNLGLAYLAQGRRDDAVRAFRVTLQIDPRQTLARHQLLALLQSSR